MDLTYKIEGLEELLKNIDNRHLLSQALKDIFTKSTLTLQRNIQKKTTKVDTGRLRASITTEIDKSELPQWGKVGTNTTYAPYVEWDTKPHWPPIKALEPWAHRHNTSAYLVALGISRHGTKGVHMFQEGLEDSKADLDKIVNDAARTIEEKFTE